MDCALGVEGRDLKHKLEKPKRYTREGLMIQSLGFIKAYGLRFRAKCLTALGVHVEKGLRCPVGQSGFPPDA